jgi:hypothetical protein
MIGTITIPSQPRQDAAGFRLASPMIAAIRIGERKRA